MRKNNLQDATDKLITEGESSDVSLSKRTLLSIAKLTAIAAGVDPETGLDQIKEKEFLLDYQVIIPNQSTKIIIVIFSINVIKL